MTPFDWKNSELLKLAAPASSVNVPAVLVLAQGQEMPVLSPDQIWIIAGVIVALILLYAIFRALNRPKKPEITQRREPTPEDRIPTKDVLEGRMEVDEQVEITDDMSLAEIKRIKSARVKGKEKATRRETSKAATERAQREREEAQKAADKAAEEAAEKDVEPSGEPSKEAKEAAEAAEAAEEAARKIEESAREEADKLAAPEAEPVEEKPVEEKPVEVEQAAPAPAEPKTLAEGLEKTRSGFIGRLSGLFSGDKLPEDMVDEVEEILFTADIGPRVAQDILQAVEGGLSGEEKQDPARIWGFIREYCAELLKAHEQPLKLESASPYVMLVVGVNGAGKTTTIGKLASKLRAQGKKVMLVAGDTFRAGAVDQLAVWAERTGMPIHQGDEEADPSSVLFAGIERGKEQGMDVIICDTSGRLQTNVNLMDELAKMARVAGKALDGAPHETMLVLDANTGQNAIVQAKKFNEAVEITGISLTKLDGTARGGVILGICDELDAPVRYIGIGESVEDLRAFDADEFVDALFM
jgi:fused signal recognition particle receptor